MQAVALLLLLLAASAAVTRILHRRAERTVPRAGDLQSVPGGCIHFVEEGPKDAPTIVLIHGLAGTLQHFTYAVSGALAQDFHVISVDRPGCGYSTRNSDDMAAIEAQARMLWDFLAKRGVSRPVLVGHSLGGTVALMMALQRPQAVAALALLAPATQPQPGIPEIFRPLHIRMRWLRHALAHTLSVPLTQLTRAAVLRAAVAPNPVPANFHTRGGGALALRPQAFVAASGDLVAARAEVGDLHELYTNRLPRGAILFGSEDRIPSPDHHGQSMAVHGLPMERILGQGHMLPVSAPEACATFIRRLARG